MPDFAVYHKSNRMPKQVLEPVVLCTQWDLDGCVDCWAGARRNSRERSLEGQLNRRRLWTGEIQGDNTGKWVYL